MAGRHPAKVDLLWCSTRWTMSGGLWATLMLRFAFWEIKGAYKIENSLTACLCSYLPPLQYKLVLFTWGAWQAETFSSGWMCVPARRCETEAFGWFARISIDDNYGQWCWESRRVRRVAVIPAHSLEMQRSQRDVRGFELNTCGGAQKANGARILTPQNHRIVYMKFEHRPC